MNRITAVVLSFVAIMILGTVPLFSIGTCLDFDGSDDYVQCSASSALRPNNYLTVEAWVYPRTSDQWSGVLGACQDNGSSESGYALYFYNNKITWWVQSQGLSDGDYNLYPSYTIPMNEWSHVAATYDYSGSTLKLYVNGYLVDTYSKGTSRPIDWTYPPVCFAFGSYVDENENEPWDGRVDDVRVWNTVRTQAQIEDNMYGELTGSESGLAGYWKLNESTGYTAYDLTSNHNNGSMQNMSTTDWVTSYAPVGQFPVGYNNEPRSLWEGLGDFWSDECSGLMIQDVPIGSISATEFYSIARNTLSGTVTTYLPTDIDIRAAREWFLDDNANETLNMRFDLEDFSSDLYVSGLSPANFKLLRRTNTSSDFSVVASGGSSFGSQIYFYGYTPSGDAFYTVGRDNALPTVTNSEMMVVGQDYAGIDGEVESDGGGTVTARGFVYSDESNPPTIDDTVYGAGTGTGIFTGSLYPLESNTEYYVRAFAVNSEGIVYGTTRTFTTLPGQPTKIFPENGVTELPRQVTVNWRWDGNGTPTGFRVYQGMTQVGSDIPWNGDIVYNQPLPQQDWNAMVNWSVRAYNDTGETETFQEWMYGVFSEPANPAEAPDEIVYSELTNVVDANPPVIPVPGIDLGEGNVQPTFDFSYLSAPNIPVLGCRVMDQPEHPVAFPENTGAAFTTTYPAGIPTILTFDFGSSRTPTQLQHWWSGKWEDITPGATFGPGTVTFEFVSTSRGVEEFVVNNGEGTLPVELSSFSAIVTSENFAMIQWTTQSETDMAGYNILRGRTDDADLAVQITTSLIPAENSTSAFEYEYVDRDVLEDNKYYYWLECVELSGVTALHGPTTVTITEEDNPGEAPDASYATAIQSIYPNPFNPSTTLSYTLSEPMHVTVTVYDLRGRTVKTLTNGTGVKGVNTANWDGIDQSGKAAASGVYLFKLEADGKVLTSKALMLK